MPEKLTAYDAIEELRTDEALAAFMAEAFSTNDAKYIAHAQGSATRHEPGQLRLR